MSVCFPSFVVMNFFESLFYNVITEEIEEGLGGEGQGVIPKRKVCVCV